MKKFLIVTSIFFALAAVVTVVVFVFLSTKLPAASLPSKEAVMESVNSTKSDVVGYQEATTSDLVRKIPAEGVPLASLPLTDSHKKALAAANIDVETFVLTPDMVTCASEKVGGERLDAIMAGSSPSILEVTKLIPCLAR